MTREQNDTDLLIMALLLVVFPPLGVLLKSNGFRAPFFVSFMLYFIFIIPSYIFSVWFCFVKQRNDSILPLNSGDYNNNLSLNSISASVTHKDIQVY
ncbi:hypothetical protein L5515_001155 [Caenorhabditis briggsae]|uniref:Uncharacterized protein n=1 Tax=Caenorhabditis briggsae TaxID=6238 RepID=A0AAE9DSM9_CAEBR|nr:hypothetical protein L3Y34_015074 [Caenorhabditis briggsae]UMM12315.1 hypothetical protein L5515_001155 [Caenorhabditis briggsae]